MNTKPGLKFVLIPVFYFCIVIALLYLHFFSGPRIVSESVAPMRILAQYNDEEDLTSLKLSLPRITLPFFPDKPLELFFADGTIVTPHITGYEVLPNGFLLTFTDGLFITCVTASPTGPIRIIPESKRPGAKPLRLVLPFLVSNDAFVRSETDARLFTFTQGSEVYTVKHPEGAAYEKDANRYVLIGNRGDLGELSIEIISSQRFRLADYLDAWKENRLSAREERQARREEARKEKEERQREAAAIASAAKEAKAKQAEEAAKAQQPEVQKPAEPQYPWFTEASLSAEGLSASAEKEIKDFVDTLYDALKNRRLREDTGSVSRKGGEAGFSEQAVTVLAAEALRRNDASGFSKAKAAADKHAGRLSVLSGPYFGNIVNLDLAALKAGTDADFAKGRLAQKDLSVFERQGLASRLLSTGESALSEELFAFASASSSEKRPLAVALGILEAVSGDPQRSLSQEAVEGVKKMVESSILPFVVKSGEDYFLSAEPVSRQGGTADIPLTIRGALALESFGGKTRLSLYRSLGDRLLLSALKLRDGDAFIPKRAVPGQAEDAASGFIAPEDIYPLLFDNPSYPHAVSLAAALGEGAYLWTVVPALSVKRSGTELVISSPWKKDRVHHFFIRGIAPFKGLKMYGINWKSDSYFQRYYAGWDYMKDQNTIYFKVTQKSETETITISLE